MTLERAGTEDNELGVSSANSTLVRAATASAAFYLGSPGALPETIDVAAIDRFTDVARTARDNRASICALIENAYLAICHEITRSHTADREESV
jgi:hypothetical protein